MKADTIRQVYLLGIFIINGILVGVIFDIFRILRKSFKTPDWLTLIEDILVWQIVSAMIIYSIFIFNNGQIRIYFFIGIVIGIILYLLTISKIFIVINVKILNIIKKTINLCLTPFFLIIKFLKKLFINPVIKIYIKLQKIIKESKKKTEKKRRININVE